MTKILEVNREGNARRYLGLVMRIQGDCDRSVGASGEARIELNRYNGLPQMRRGLDDFSRIAICRTRFGNA